MRILAVLLSLLFWNAAAFAAAPHGTTEAATNAPAHAENIGNEVADGHGDATALTQPEAAAHENAHHEAAGPPQFAVETFPSQLFWLAVSFGGLYLLLAGAALPRIEQGITARADHIQNLLSDARRIRDDAESHKNDMNMASDAAHQKAHEMLNKAAVESQDIASRRNHELEAVLQTKIKASEDRINTARANAVQSVREASQILLPVVLQKMADMKLSDKDIANLVANVEPPKTNGVRGAA